MLPTGEDVKRANAAEIEEWESKAGEVETTKLSPEEVQARINAALRKRDTSPFAPYKKEYPSAYPHAT
jgi:hypothetical protein